MHGLIRPYQPHPKSFYMYDIPDKPKLPVFLYLQDNPTQMHRQTRDGSFYITETDVHADHEYRLEVR